MISNPAFAGKISRFLARIAPGYFARKLVEPFFLMGSGRSGTTMLLRMLASHRDVAPYPNEANHLWHPETYPWADSRHKSSLPPFWLDPVEFTRLSLEFRPPSQPECIRPVFGAYQFLMRKKCFLNKSAMITFMIPFVLQHFPEARFIHLVRDGRAVALSYARKNIQEINKSLADYKKHTPGISFEELLRRCAETWKLQVEEVERRNKDFGLQTKGIMLEVRYEGFVAAPGDCLGRIAEFMDIDPKGFARTDYSHIYSTNYKYKETLDKDDIREITEIMRPTLEKKGYM